MDNREPCILLNKKQMSKKDLFNTNNTKSHIKLRGCILKRLYEMFKEYPYAVIELRQIEEDCQTNSKELNWNLVYLEKCGYVELGQSIEAPPYIACSASMTAEGIDLVEDEDKFYRRFSHSKEEKPENRESHPLSSIDESKE